MVLAFFISGDFCVFALIDGGDEAYFTLDTLQKNIISHIFTHHFKIIFLGIKY